MKSSKFDVDHSIFLGWEFGNWNSSFLLIFFWIITQNLQQKISENPFRKKSLLNFQIFWKYFLKKRQNLSRTELFQKFFVLFFFFEMLNHFSGQNPFFLCAIIVLDFLNFLNVFCDMFAVQKYKCHQKSFWLKLIEWFLSHPTWCHSKRRCPTNLYFFFGNTKCHFHLLKSAFGFFIS